MNDHFYIPTFTPKNEVLRIEQMDNGGCVVAVHKKEGYPVNDRDRCAFSSITDVIKAMIESFPQCREEVLAFLGAEQPSIKVVSQADPELWTIDK